MVIAFLLGIIFAVWVFVLLYAYTNPFSQSAFGERLLITNEAVVTKMTPAELAQTRSLIQKGYISKPDDLLTALTSFYDTVVIVLIAIISLAGVFAYVSVRALSRRAAEDMAKESAKAAVDSYLESMVFNKMLIGAVQDELGEIKSDSEEMLEKLASKLDEVEVVLRQAERMIANNDRAEILPEQTIESDPGQQNGNLEK